ncbi:hypothetical protein SAMN05192554_13314 [Haloarchaeobius iranensis]|uniref:GIY-YIG nuclease family protein n=2 Tax=Haloarchaeobius iranensis TaxID=996166 RepID=A0A1H0B3J1_9EURY|nr:hypothetical protein SAMN05192554_13314 [Haloarchaeobius iranensis]
MPFRDPHTAAPCLWAIRDRDGPDLEISWTTPDRATEKQPRKGIEAALIALHRREIGHSPTANFGRIIEGYKQSGYSSDGFVGGPLSEDETEPNTEPGVGPLEWTDHERPLSTDWMGLDWTEPEPLDEVSTDTPTTDGLYRLWNAGDPEPLTYIGESSNLKSRLYSHRRERDGELQYSYTVLDEHNAQHKRQEVETELIGAHWVSYECAPVDQF